MNPNPKALRTPLLRLLGPKTHALRGPLGAILSLPIGPEVDPFWDYLIGF